MTEDLHVQQQMGNINIWFQQDGAASHVARTVMSLMQNFSRMVYLLLWRFVMV
jgi:hypothetical protein